MKHLLLLALATLSASSAFAQVRGNDITIYSGTSTFVTVGVPTVVHCEQGRSALPLCLLKKDQIKDDAYHVMVADQYMVTNLSLDNALAQIAKLRTAGVCN